MPVNQKFLVVKNKDEKEIKYLHDNGFKVLTMADIGYDTNSNYLYLKR